MSPIRTLFRRLIVPAIAGIAASVLACPVAAETMGLTWSPWTITVADTDLNDGIAAGYQASNLRRDGQTSVYREDGSAIMESFSIDSPDVLPLDAVAAYRGVEGRVAVTETLGESTSEVSFPAAIFTRIPGVFLRQEINAHQYFVLQPHTILTFAGTYHFERIKGPAYVEVEGGEVWLDYNFNLRVDTIWHGLSWWFDSSEENSYVIQLRNDSSVPRELPLGIFSQTMIGTRFVADVPEPATWAMFGVGLALLALVRRTRPA